MFPGIKGKFFAGILKKIDKLLASNAPEDRCFIDKLKQFSTEKFEELALTSDSTLKNGKNADNLSSSLPQAETHVPQSETLSPADLELQNSVPLLPADVEFELPEPEPLKQVNIEGQKLEPLPLADIQFDLQKEQFDLQKEPQLQVESLLQADLQFELQLPEPVQEPDPKACFVRHGKWRKGIPPDSPCK